MRAFAVPTTFLSKNPVDHTWQGTKDPPRIPTKNLKTMRPAALVTVPAKAVGIAPKRRHPANVTLGPKRSHKGPAKTRTRRLNEGVSYRVVKWSTRRYLRCSEGNNVGVGNLILAELEILLDCESQLEYVRCVGGREDVGVVSYQWWERIPMAKCQYL